MGLTLTNAHSSPGIETTVPECIPSGSNKVIHRCAFAGRILTHRRDVPTSLGNMFTIQGASVLGEVSLGKNKKQADL